MDLGKDLEMSKSLDELKKLVRTTKPIKTITKKPKKFYHNVKGVFYQKGE